MVHIFNPRHACAARVTVVGLCVCVCLSVTILALQATRRLMSNTNSFSSILAILLKRLRSRATNWHGREQRCVAQPINKQCACVY